MIDGVTDTQEVAKPETTQLNSASDKALNFRKLEAARDAEREARIRAEMQAESLRKEIESIKDMLRPPEKDPLDEVDGYIDPAVFKAKLEKERAAFERRAEEIAKKTYEEQKRREEQTNFLQRLKTEYSDYDQVMTEDNVKELEENAPEFLSVVLEIPDEYVRRKQTYNFIKRQKQRAPVQKEPETPSIKQTVDENLRNPFYIPAGAGIPAAVEFDVKSKNARELAYAKLKAAQRRPIGGSLPNK